jgi:DNA-binding transcriptional LysR family regulator
MYIDLVETESFTQAAQINQVTQSAISQQISAMERLFKALLVQRSKKQFRLTREGQILYDHAKQIAQTFASLQHKMQEIKDIISGNIQVSTVYSIGLHELPGYVKKFLQVYPTVNVHVEYRHPGEVYEDVMGNVADLGLVACPEKWPGVDTIPLHEYEMVLICAPQHPLARKKSLRVKELAGQRFVSFEADLAIRKAIDRVLRQNAVSVQHAMEFDNIETIKRAVEIEAGIAIVPRSTVVQELAAKTLAELKLEGAQVHCPWAVIHKTHKTLSPAMKQFITVLKAPPAV